MEEKKEEFVMNCMSLRCIMNEEHIHTQLKDRLKKRNTIRKENQEDLINKDTKLLHTLIQNNTQ